MKLTPKQKEKILKDGEKAHEEKKEEERHKCGKLPTSACKQVKNADKNGDQLDNKPDKKGESTLGKKDTKEVEELKAEAKELMKKQKEID